MGYHSIEHPSADADTVVAEHRDVVLHILSCLLYACVFEQRSETPQYLFRLLFVVGQSHVICLLRFDGKRQTYYLCLERIERRGLGIEAESTMAAEYLYQTVYLVVGLYQNILVPSIVDSF